MNKTAFCDLDGTLLSCNLVTMHAYYARNDRSLLKSVYQFTKVLLSVPLLFGLDLYSRSLFNVFSFRAYRGMHRDRLIGLADDLFEVTLKPSIFPQAQALINTTRELGYRNVLVTGTLDFTIRPVALHFGFEEVICNRLEFKNHIATGRVLPPLLAENEKARSIREYAAQEDIDQGGSNEVRQILEAPSQCPSRSVMSTAVDHGRFPRVRPYFPGWAKEISAVGGGDEVGVSARKNGFRKSSHESNGIAG